MGVIIQNNNPKKDEELQKENNELKVKLEKERELRHKAEGRLEEYRRRYEVDKTTFTSEVTDDESA